MEKLKKMYGLQDPQQIKMRIIWMALKQLIKASYGNSPKNKKVLQTFDNHWKMLEKQEKG